ncbi:MAG: fimbrial biogenesis chaperone [Kluyvera intermedia]
MVKTSATALLLCFLTLTADAGVTLGGTRVIYHEVSASVSITLENNDPQPYLIKSQVLAASAIPGAEVIAPPFSLIPPLFLLPGKRQNKIRLIADDSKLAKGKESLFDLTIGVIPSSETKLAVNSVQIAIRSHLKLIYRPKNLPGSPQEAYRKLSWHRTQQGVSVKNPTPFYATLFNVIVNGLPVSEPGVVAPYSERELRWCHGVSRCDIRLQSIDDFGGILAVKQVDFVSSQSGSR